MHRFPAVPHVRSSVPRWQVPFASQQPFEQFDGPHCFAGPHEAATRAPVASVAKAAR